jgi:hypothetical protein
MDLDIAEKVYEASLESKAEWKKYTPLPVANSTSPFGWSPSINPDACSSAEICELKEEILNEPIPPKHTVRGEIYTWGKFSNYKTSENLLASSRFEIELFDPEKNFNADKALEENILQLVADEFEIIKLRVKQLLASHGYEEK